MNLQRTANSVLTVCLSQGDNRNKAIPRIVAAESTPKSVESATESWADKAATTEPAHSATVAAHSAAEPTTHSAVEPTAATLKEEIVAGAYQRAGWEVILTPRCGDRGRDVIATRSGVISIRIVDQIKAYRLGHLITADEVQSMLGVLHVDRYVSKGLVTTTGRFAPGIEKDRGIIAFMPYRLNLKNGDQLRRLLELADNKPYAVRA